MINFFKISLLFCLLKILDLLIYKLSVLPSPFRSKCIIWTQILYAVG